jgi:GMP synthase-like glutamine amidotransferase
MSNKTALAIRHVAFEDLGSMADTLHRTGYRIEYLEACEEDLTSIDPTAVDLLIVLGGPIGVYDESSYPIVATEADILKRRMDADLPTVGICLGAQLMAHALGSPKGDRLVSNRPDLGGARELSATLGGKRGLALAWRHVRSSGRLRWAGLHRNLQEPGLLPRIAHIGPTVPS